MREVSGRILLQDWGGEAGPATVYVRLFNTTLIDAPARMVNEVVLHRVRLDRVRNLGIKFSVVAPKVDARARYEVGVLVDLDGDTKPSHRDYVNTRAYPVLTRGFPDRVEIRVHPIG